MSDLTLKEILMTLQGMRNLQAEAMGMFEAHSKTSYNEQLELRGEVKNIIDHLLYDLKSLKEELDKQTILLEKLAEDVTDYRAN